MNSEKKRLKSYKEYAGESLASSKSRLEDTLTQIEAEGRTTRSARAERLSDSGLSSSGYSEYLKMREMKSSLAEENEAKRELLEAEANAYEGYAKYLNDYLNIQETAKNKFISQLIKDGVFDEREARRRAYDSGLSEENAEEAANLGSLIARKQAIKRASEYASTRNYSYKGAKHYALSLGLSEADAKRVAEAVGRVTESEANKYAELDKDSYFELIKDRLNE